MRPQDYRLPFIYRLQVQEMSCKEPSLSMVRRSVSSDSTGRS